MSALEEICGAADAAMAKVGNDANRIHQLTDDDLTSVAVKVKTLRPILEQELVARTGSVTDANTALARVQAMSQGKIIKLVNAANAAMRIKRTVTVNQLAALVFDAAVGCGAIQVEQERRQACGAGRMN